MNPTYKRESNLIKGNPIYKRESNLIKGNPIYKRESYLLKGIVGIKAFADVKKFVNI